ncbi:MAG TPA: NAD(P)H-dependent oxidoreductase [Bauldia sp.]|nr:NAD(P)H-dependent oxidoreductase [Bauldia sp.]
MLKIGIIAGTTRPNRRVGVVANWFLELAKARTDVAWELVDIAAYDLPNLDEPMPPSMKNYAHEHTKKWSQKVAELDGYIFVTPEYNHSYSGSLKNAIDFVYHEWTNKAAGFVSYGTTGGVRAVEHLRGVMAELQIADVRAHVSLSLYTDFVNFSEFKPGAGHKVQIDALLDQIIAWSGAMQGLRQQLAAKAAA